MKGWSVRKNEAFINWLVNGVCQDEKKKIAIDAIVTIRWHFNSSPQQKNRLENKLWKALYADFPLIVTISSCISDSSANLVNTAARTIVKIGKNNLWKQ